jgi:hypothetical protein
LLLNIRVCRKGAGDWSIWRRSLKILESDAACLAIEEEEEEKEEERDASVYKLAVGDLRKTCCQNLSMLRV